MINPNKVNATVDCPHCGRRIENPVIRYSAEWLEEARAFAFKQKAIRLSHLDEIHDLEIEVEENQS